jgi:hypothetical protein
MILISQKLDVTAWSARRAKREESSFERFFCMVVSRARFPVAGLNSVLKVYWGAIESWRSFEYNKCELGTEIRQ